MFVDPPPMHFYFDLYVQEYVPFPVVNDNFVLYMRLLKKDTCINVIRFHLPIGRPAHGTDRHRGLGGPPGGIYGVSTIGK